MVSIDRLDCIDWLFGNFCLDYYQLDTTGFDVSVSSDIVSESQVIDFNGLNQQCTLEQLQSKLGWEDSNLSGTKRALLE